MRLVIADDHLLLLEALAYALSDHGFTVEATATTPAGALRAVALHDPDLLLIDVAFPQGSGLDAARQVVEAHTGCRVVMITGSDDPRPLAKALELGVAGYLRKDLRVPEMAAALELAASGGVALDRRLLHQVRRGTEHVPDEGPVGELTPRESCVLDLLSDGLSTKEIVRELGVSRSTVGTHVQNIFAKLGVHTRLEAVAVAASRDAAGRTCREHVTAS